MGVGAEKGPCASLCQSVAHPGAGGLARIPRGRAPLLRRFPGDHPRRRALEKYRAPLLAWWASLTEGFKRCRLVVEKVQQTLDEVCQWLGQSISAMLALAYLQRGEQFLQQLIDAGSKKLKARHLAMLPEGTNKRPYVLRPV